MPTNHHESHAAKVYGDLLRKFLYATQQGQKERMAKLDALIVALKEEYIVECLAWEKLYGDDIDAE